MTSERRPYHHGDLRNALLDAATALADARGPAAVTLREACRRVGVSPAAAYRHFADQAALLDAVADAALHELGVRMRHALANAVDQHGADAADPRTVALLRFRSVGLAYVEYALERPGRFRTAYGRPDAARDDGTPDHPRRILAEMLDELVAVDLLDAERRRHADVAAWSGVHGLAVLVLDRVLAEADPQPLVEATLDMIGLGLCAPALLAAAGSTRRAAESADQPDQAASKKASSRRIARP